MTYFTQMETNLHLLDQIEEKNFFPECLSGITSKEAALAILNRLNPVFTKNVGYNARERMIQLERMVLNRPELLPVLNQFEPGNIRSEEAKLLLAYFETYDVPEDPEDFACDLQSYVDANHVMDGVTFDLVVFHALKKDPRTRRVLYENATPYQRQDVIERLQKDEDWKEHLPDLAVLGKLPEGFRITCRVSELLERLEHPGVLSLYQTAGSYGSFLSIRDRDYTKEAELFQKIRERVTDSEWYDTVKWFSAADLPVRFLQGFLRFLENHPAKEALTDRSHFLNACTDFHYQNLFLTAKNSGELDLLTYAVSHGKKAFLRLLEENWDLVRKIPVNAILWEETFWNICNLNSLRKKDLEALTKDDYISLKLLEDHGPFTFQEIWTVGRQKYQVRSVYVCLDPVLGVDEKLKRIRQLFHGSIEWDRFSELDLPKIAKVLSRESIVSYRDRHAFSCESLQDWLCLILAEEKKPVVSQRIAEISSPLDVKILLNHLNCPELLEQGLAAFKAQFIYQDTDSQWLMEMLQMSTDHPHLDAFRDFCLSGNARIAHRYYQSVDKSEQQENLLLIVKAVLYGKLEEIKYENLSREVGFSVPSEQKAVWKENTSKKNGSLDAVEYIDFWHCMNIGVLPGDTCMNYNSGMYNECLLSTFDANKKILYVKKDGVILGRAILRLTKISDHPKNALRFEDVEQTDEDVSEDLVLFLEKSYQNGYSGKQKEAIQRLLIALAKEKARKMDVDLLLADDYTELPEIKHLEKKNTHVYISSSKNGKQYLDSLGGNCETGGYYRHRELPYWRCGED